MKTKKKLQIKTKKANQTTTQTTNQTTSQTTNQKVMGLKKRTQEGGGEEEFEKFKKNFQEVIGKNLNKQKDYGKDKYLKNCEITKKPLKDETITEYSQKNAAAAEAQWTKQNKEMEDAP